jgi:hypothetical protein
MSCARVAPFDIARLEMALRIKPAKSRTGKGLRTEIGEKVREAVGSELPFTNADSKRAVALVRRTIRVAAALDHHFPNCMLARAGTVPKVSVVTLAFGVFGLRHVSSLVKKPTRSAAISIAIARLLSQKDAKSASPQRRDQHLAPQPHRRHGDQRSQLT